MTSGEEGFRTDGNLEEPYAWLNNGFMGVDFTCNIGSPDIDVRPNLCPRVLPGPAPPHQFCAPRR